MRCRCLSNAASARSTGLPVNSGCLHCPQSGALASWSARTRLVVWQWGQTMCRDSLTRARLWLVGWNARLAGLLCLSRGQLQFTRSYFHSCSRIYSLAWRPKTLVKTGQKRRFSAFFEAQPALSLSFDLKNWLFRASKVAESQSIRAQTAPVLVARGD